MLVFVSANRADGARGVDAPACGDFALQRVQLVNGREESLAQLLDREVRLDREHQSGHARDERRRHRSARVLLILAVEPCAQNLFAGRGDVDVLRAVVREGGQAVVAVERGDRDDVRQLVVRRKVRRAVGVLRVVARGGDEDRKSTRLNSSHVSISYAVFCLKKKKKNILKSLFNTNKKHHSSKEYP